MSGLRYLVGRIPDTQILDTRPDIWFDSTLQQETRNLYGSFNLENFIIQHILQYENKHFVVRGVHRIFSAGEGGQ